MKTIVFAVLLILNLFFSYRVFQVGDFLRGETSHAASEGFDTNEAKFLYSLSNRVDCTLNFRGMGAFELASTVVSLSELKSCVMPQGNGECGLSRPLQFTNGWRELEFTLQPQEQELSGGLQALSAKLEVISPTSGRPLSIWLGLVVKDGKIDACLPNNALHSWADFAILRSCVGEGVQLEGEFGNPQNPIQCIHNDRVSSQLVRENLCPENEVFLGFQFDSTGGEEAVCQPIAGLASGCSEGSILFSKEGKIHCQPPEATK